MSNPIALLKSLFRPTELETGSLFAIGAATADEEYLWRVCEIRPLLGVPHALIEQPASGHSKTVAVAALLADRTFQVVAPAR